MAARNSKIPVLGVLKELTKKEIRLAIKSLDEIEDLLTAAWVKGTEQYILSDEDRTDPEFQGTINKKRKAEYAYCLVGALQHVDGPTEKLVGALLAACTPNYSQQESAENILNNTYSEHNIMAFNDDAETTLKDVLRVVNKARSRLLGMLSGKPLRL